MTKTLVKGSWYTVTTASTCTITDANGTTLGIAEAGKQFAFQATTELITFSDAAATVLANPKLAPVAAGNSSGGNAAEKLRLELLGESFDDVLHWTDSALELVGVIVYLASDPLPGFEEPVDRDGCIYALRLFNRREVLNDWVNEEAEHYCLFTAYSPSGELTGTTRGVFVITKQDAYVEFDTPLNVSAGGKVKFEFGTYYIPYEEDLGVGGALGLLAGNMTSGYVVKKVGARLLEGSAKMGVPGRLPEILDRTLCRTIYYKKTGAVDEKIAAHAADPEAMVTVEVFACNFLEANTGVTYASPCSAAATWAILDPTDTIQNTWSDMALIAPVDYTPIWSELTFKDGEVYGYKWVVKRKHAAAVVQRWKEWKEGSEAAGGDTWLITVSGAVNS